MFVAFVPFRRYCFKRRPKKTLIDVVLKSAGPLLKRLDSLNVFIDEAPSANAPPGGIGEIPFLSVEAKSVVDHQSRELKLPLVTKENTLAVIGIACPFVEDQHSHKIREIGDPAEVSFRQQILDLEQASPVGSESLRLARAETQSRTAGDASTS